MNEYSIRSYNPVTKEKMGKSLIINNYSYGGGRSRYGSMEDLKRMRWVMEYLNFEVTVKQDLQGNEILSEVKKFRDDVNADCDMISLVLMGHGTRECILRLDDVGVTYDELYKLFNNENCRDLIGKPKLFIIQVFPDKF